MQLLTHDAGRTPHDDGQKHTAIGHLSDSGDLKKFTKSQDYKIEE